MDCLSDGASLCGRKQSHRGRCAWSMPRYSEGGAHKPTQGAAPFAIRTEQEAGVDRRDLCLPRVREKSSI